MGAETSRDGLSDGIRISTKSALTTKKKTLRHYNYQNKNVALEQQRRVNHSGGCK